MQHIKPITAFSMAIGIPDTISHIIFARRLTAPPPYITSFPNGKNANPANLKHCKPIGIPIMDIHHRLLWSSLFVTLRPNFCHRGYTTP